MEPLETDTLYLAATRPAMFMGVPIVMAALMLMAVGFIVVLLKNPLYLAVMIPVWFSARELVSRDYNAVDVLLLYLRTAGRSVDSRDWGGPSVTTHPIRLKRRGRGMIDVG
jgi:type IV secretion system protein VirB3